MEDKMMLVAVAVAVAVLLAVLPKLKSLLAGATAAKLNLPPGPSALPVIGGLHHLSGSPLLFRTLRGLARRHGGALMLVRLGEVPTLVVSSAEAARAVMKTHDAAFAGRFTTPTLATITYGGADLVFAPYGERWRQLRKVLVLEMLTAARVRSFRRVREEEAARFLRCLAARAASAGAAAVDLSAEIARLLNDTFVRECVGSRYRHQDEFLDAFHAALRLTSGLTLADLFPSSRAVRLLAGAAQRKALACRDRMKRVIELVMEEKKAAMAAGDTAAQESFMGVLLKLQQEAALPIPLSDHTITMLLFDLFAAGSDTSSTTLTWAMTELVRSPAAMAKAQAEVREAFQGKSAPITEDDVAGARLGYVKLVIKEAMRLHAPAPFLIPRRCREACQVMGYDVPEGTAVLVNVWAIGREPEYWGDDAEEFRPERFENSDVDYKGTDFEYLPFGAGRRMCPGINLGLANIELALASLLYHFDWKLPEGMKPEDVDVSEAEGVIASKRTGLVLHPVIRNALADA